MTSNLLIDISRIPQQLAGLESLTRTMAVSFLALAVPLTVLDHNVKAAGAKSPRELPSYQGFVVRLLVVAVLLLSYKRLFSFILRLFQLMCFAILSETDWGNFLTMALMDGGSKHPMLSILFNSATSIQGAVLVLSSLVAVTARDVIVMLQGCFLSLMFAFGPIAIVCAVNERSIHITKGWLANTVQIASWSFFLRLIVRVWLNLHPMSGQMGQGMPNDFLGILTVNVCFLVLVLGTPLVATRLLSGGNLAAFGATAFGAAQTLLIARTISTGRFLNREAQKLSRAPAEERVSLLQHPISAPMTALYRRTFGEPAKAAAGKAPARGKR